MPGPLWIQKPSAWLRRYGLVLLAGLQLILLLYVASAAAEARDAAYAAGDDTASSSEIHQLQSEISDLRSEVSDLASEVSGLRLSILLK